MCVFELDYSKSAQSSVTLSSKIGIDSLGFSFEASGFSERFEKFYADYASARNPSSFKRDTRIESKWEMLRDCFSFSLLFSFLVRLIFACKIREKHTRFVSFCRENYISKNPFSILRSFSRACELHTTKNIYALTRGYVHGLAMNYLRPIVYDLFHDKGKNRRKESWWWLILSRVLLRGSPFFGFISSILSRRIRKRRSFCASCEFVKCF